MGRNVTFRANCGVVVANRDGLVLALERTGLPGSWQMPQGGLEEGEEPFECALRELEEETGIPRAAVELLDEHPDWLAYELPPERRRKELGRGQVQRWFLVRLARDDTAIEPERTAKPEFMAWRWMRLQDLIEAAVAFRRPTYRKLLERFRPHLAP